MKDIFGRTLAIGDIVACERPSYKGLYKAQIIKFTPQMVRVKFLDMPTYHKQETLQPPGCVVKFVEEKQTE